MNALDFLITSICASKIQKHNRSDSLIVTQDGNKRMCIENGNAYIHINNLIFRCALDYHRTLKYSGI